VIERREQGLDPLGIDETKELSEQERKKAGGRKEGGKYHLKEYLQTESDTGGGPPSRAVYPIVQRYRCRYKKVGNSRYISHLELANVFFRAARRAEIAVAYSRGFNPRAKMSFGPPSQLGLESHCEYVDIALTETYDPEEFQKRLNTSLPETIQITEVFAIDEKTDSLQASIAAQRFELKIGSSTLSEIELELIKSRIQSWGEIEIARRRKKKRTVSKILLGQCMNSLSLEGDTLVFEIRYDNSSATVKPFEVVEGITGLKAEQFEVRKVDISFEDRQASKLASAG
jgi:radical SAM-linked protein